MTVQTIEDQWLDFSKILPKDAGQVQRDETRYAFWAGALSMFMSLTADVSALPDQEAADALSAYQREIDEYVAAMGRRAYAEAKRQREAKGT